MKLAIALLASIGLVNAADYAVIVAGSKGYGNYRHQADACNAYQLLTKKGGMPAENVILMMYDDVANSPSNPFPGKMFNKPTAAGTPGVDVYEGCKVDYKGSDATGQNWVNIITGDEAAMKGKGTGRVLKSTKNDRVFLNFVDHGGVGIIAFPMGPYMKATVLNQALTKMYKSNMYDKLVFYMEACESGSMFEGILPKGQNIYVTTAANAHESSWGTYCPPQDSVNGKHMRSCLGDLYSVKWMESAYEKGLNQTLEEHYTLVKAETTKSHVMQYGDMSFNSEPIGNYMGSGGKATETETKTTTNSAGDISSRDIPLHLAYYDYLRADKTDLAAMQAAGVALQKEIQARLDADQLFSKLTNLVAGENSMALFNKPGPETLLACNECCDAVYLAVQERCGGFTDYSMQYSHVVPNLCEFVQHDAVATQKIVDTLAEHC